MPKKIILNPAFKDAPYKYAFCDTKSKNIQRLPKEFVWFRYNKDFKRVPKYIEVEV